MLDDLGTAHGAVKLNSTNWSYAIHPEGLAGELFAPPNLGI